MLIHANDLFRELYIISSTVQVYLSPLNLYSFS